MSTCLFTNGTWVTAVSRCDTPMNQPQRTPTDLGSQVDHDGTRPDGGGAVTCGSSVDPGR